MRSQIVVLLSLRQSHMSPSQGISHHALKPLILIVVRICSVFAWRIIPKHVAKEIIDRIPDALNPLAARSLAPNRPVVDVVADDGNTDR